MKPRRILLASLAFSVFGLIVAAPAAVPPPEKLLPTDTVLVVTVPDYAKSKTVWQQSPSSRLWEDPSLKPFKDKLVGKLQSDLIAPMEKQLGITLADYAGLAQGQLTLALTPKDWEGNNPGPPGVLMLMDARDKSGVLKSNLATLKTKWVDSGKQVRVEKIRDVEFATLIFKPDDIKKTLSKAFPDANDANEGLEQPKPDRPGKGFELLVGQSDSLLVVGTSAKDIEKVLVNQAGTGASSLADHAVFSANHSALFRDSQMYGWVNTKTIIGVVARSLGRGGDGEGGGGLRPDKILQAVGLNGLQAASFNVKDTGDGVLVGFNLNVPESNRRGLFKMISFEPKDANPPAFVPADAVKFTRLRLDLPKAWATLESSLTDASPEAAGVVKLVIDNAGKDRDPNFNLRQSLLANLGDDVITYQKAPRKQTLAELNSPPTLILVGSARAEQVANAIKALASVMPRQKVKEREFLGRKVYALNLGSSQDPGGKEVERVLHYTASGGYVAMSTDVAMLEEFMRSSDSAPKALSNLPGLSDAAQKVGGMGTGLFGFENQLEQARHMIETLKKESGTLANLFNASPLAGRFGVGGDGAKLRDWVDFSLLPSFDQLAKYFYLTVWSGSVNAEGLALKFYTPNPPQLKK
jgi:hypothetical protein